MAVYGFATTPGDVQEAAVATLKLKALGDDAYYSLLQLREGIVSIEMLDTKDSLQREQGYSYAFRAEAKVMATNKVNLLEVLDAIGSTRIDIKITTTAGDTYSSALMTAPYVGTKWTFVSDKDMDGDRYVLFQFTRNITSAELTELIGTPPADGTPNVTDDLYALNSLVTTDITAAGMAEIAILKPSETYEAIGLFRDAKLTLELQTIADSRSRETSRNSVKVTLETESMQAAETELVLWQATRAIANGWKATMIDATIFTFGTALGTKATFFSDKDSDGNKRIMVMASGVIQLSALDGIIS